MRDDTQELRRELTDSIERVLHIFAPGHIIHRGRAYIAPLDHKRLGPFQVGLIVADPRLPRGCWCDFSSGQKGGPIKLLAYLLNGQSRQPTHEDWHMACEEARKLLGFKLEPLDVGLIRRATETAKRLRDEAQALKAAEAADRRLDKWVARIKAQDEAVLRDYIESGEYDRDLAEYNARKGKADA